MDKPYQPLRRLFLLLGYLFIINGMAGCQQAKILTTLMDTPTDIVTISTTLDPTPEPTATMIVLPTLVEQCPVHQGQIDAQVIDSQVMSEPLEFNVYLPPCYDASRQQGYPVLYMFHGQSYTQDQWIHLGLTNQLDDLILKHQAEPFIIVMPFERKSWDDPFTTGFSESVINEMIPWIEDHYDVCRDRLCRAIGGLSRGAAWAIHLGFTNWQLFGFIGAHSAVPFEGDTTTLPDWVSQIPEGQLPKIYMDIGQKDQYLKYAANFEAKLKLLDVPHDWIVQPGNHDDVYWQSHVLDYLLWYSENFENQ